MSRSLQDEVENFPLTMISAPAGYGKTLLLAEWAGAGGADKAWVSADGGDNDPGRFFAAVLAALRECPLVPADSALRANAPAAEPADFVARLVDAVDELPGRICLILDDAHEIVDPRSRHAIELLVRHQPANLRLILATRSDPSLPLARLRLHGRLGELREPDLRFSEAEAGTLFRQAGVTLEPGQLAGLVEKTGGWAAGLRLASRSLRETADRDGFVAKFTGDDRAVADYLVSEVLTRLPDGTREFLRAVSICEDLTPALAAVLSGRSDAADIFAELEHEGSLVIRTGEGRRWYRMHPLLRSYLQAELTRLHPRATARLHAVAAVWLADDRQIGPAFAHATRAQDPATLSSLLGRHGLDLLLAGDHRTVLRALELAGPAEVSGSAWLTVLSGLAHLQAGDLATARARVAEAGAKAESPHAEAASVQTLLASACAMAAGEAPEAGTEVPAAGGVAAWTSLDKGWRLVRENRLREAQAELCEAEELARGYGTDYVTLHCLAARSVAAWLEGDYATMSATSAESLALAKANGWEATPWLTSARVTKAFGHLLRAEPEDALDSARAARHFGAPVSGPVGYAIEVVEALCVHDAGDPHAAARKLRLARAELGEAALLPAVAAGAALAEFRCALALGREVVAREVLTWARERLGQSAEPALMTAWHRYAAKDFAGAGQALARASVLPARLPLLTAVEIRLMAVAVAAATGRRTLAIEALGEALRLAAPARVLRPFAEADRGVRQLLVDQLGGFDRLDGFAHEASRVMCGSRRDRGAALLTDREHAVLGRLASPQSLEELAESLSVSVNTVKTHVRAIYTKLGVSNRRAAVTTARERGLA
ncbi:helix-turn-helix transcriptional regulator [Amycolatopsis acidicola]|uniref:Helix-turn-helix transcriptional regulator n=1 Tax=Amycolatopsis acidicola TaxID=2596893 RepID=A0A5N0URS5_9PSEU|nr:LuxR C-terminal-related transcriptional regulator [Amycolatopsis acidicola]KAA9150397.1 helix-turn-helix transcriptional regulator [Amycolatopsis acidicola]